MIHFLSEEAGIVNCLVLHGALTILLSLEIWAWFGWQNVSSAGFSTPTSLASVARTLILPVPRSGAFASN